MHYKSMVATAGVFLPFFLGTLTIQAVLGKDEPGVPNLITLAHSTASSQPPGNEFEVDSDDPYRQLGLTREATHDDIRRAFRKAAQRFHPDSGGSDQDFIRICHAYSILSDPLKKAHYDQTGRREAWSDFESASGSSADFYNIISRVFKSYSEAGPFSEMMLLEGIASWSRMMGVAEVRRIYMDLVRGNFLPHVSDRVRFSATYVLAQFIVVPEIRLFVIDFLSKHRSLDSSQVQSVVRAMAIGLEPFGPSVSSLADQILVDLQGIANRHHASSWRPGLVAGISAFIKHTPHAARWLIEETKSAQHGEASRVAAMLSALETPELKPQILEIALPSWIDVLTSIINKSRRSRAASMSSRSSLKSAVHALVRLAAFHATARERLRAILLNRAHRATHIEIQQAYNHLAQQPEVDTSDLDSEGEYDYQEPEQRLLALNSVGRRALLPSVVPPGSGDGLGSQSAMGDISLIIEEKANLPEGQGDQVLLSNPQALAQIAAAQAKIAQELAIAQASIVHRIGPSARGMKIQIGFGLDCSRNFQR